MRKYFWCGAILMVAAAVAVYAAAIYTGRHPDFLLGALKQVAALAGKRVGPSRPTIKDPQPVDSAGEESEFDEAQSGEMYLPDQLDPVEGMRCLPLPPEQPIEPSEILGGHQFGGLAEPTPALPATDPTAALHILPQAAPGLMDPEDLCPSVMPHCREEESGPPPAVGRASGQGSYGPWQLFIKEPAPSTESACPKCPKCTGKIESGSKAPPAKKDITFEGEEQEKGSNKESMLPAESLQKRLDSLLKPYKPCETCPSARKVDTLDFRPSDARKGEFDPIPF